MAALLPSEAVCLVYRRYLKSANKIPNVTIRMLLLQQIRFGFRRNSSLTSVAAQRELVRQSQKDLSILEDDRLSRTLYINKLGMVSCLDWEIRRTEYHVSQKSMIFLNVLFFVGFTSIALMLWNIEPVESAHPEINKMVQAMALRLEGDTIDDVRAQRAAYYNSSMERQQNRVSLEGRILSNFHDAPFAQQPTLRHPDGLVRS